jgi:hypothetical protein
MVGLCRIWGSARSASACDLRRIIIVNVFGLSVTSQAQIAGNRLMVGAHAVLGAAKMRRDRAS